MQGSAKPREASDLGLAPLAGAINRNVLNSHWDFYLVRKARARGASLVMIWPRVLNHEGDMGYVEVIG